MLQTWNALTGSPILKVNFFEETKSHQIAVACYSPEQMLYFVFATDFKLHCFNENLVKVASVHSKTRLVRQCEWHDREKMLLTAGVDGCCLLKLRINSSHSAKMQLVLDPRGNALKIELHYKLKLESPDAKQWIRGLHYDSQTDLLAVWSNTDLNFYHISSKPTPANSNGEEQRCTLEHKYSYPKLCQPDDSITQCLHNRKFGYFVVGTQMGFLAVWKLSPHKIFIHSFERLVRAVTCL